MKCMHEHVHERPSQEKDKKKKLELFLNPVTTHHPSVEQTKLKTKTRSRESSCFLMLCCRQGGRVIFFSP